MRGKVKSGKPSLTKKYSSNRRANLCVPSSNPKTSRFWKGVSSTIQALKFGYRWKVGDGRKIRLWEDTWSGNSPLSVQFWPVYTICNEQNIVLADAWDGTTLKISFRRTFSDRLIEQWFQLEEIVKS